MGKKKVSPPKRPMPVYRTTLHRHGLGKTGFTSFALNKATKALSSVDSANTQRGNMKVVIRVRPENSRESCLKAKTIVHAVDSNMVLFDPPDDNPDFYYKGVKQSYQQGKRNKNIKFAFDNVYGPQSTNEEIFRDVINPMLDTLLSGFNCSVFAYGPTGSGKTHTMIGSLVNPGLTFQTVMELYRRLEEMVDEYETEVTVSYLEVYNETVRDLLQTTSGDLQLREDTNGVVVANLTVHKPQDSTALLNLLAQGNSVRSQHPTDLNAESSRSHAVFQVFIKLRSRFTELTNKYKSAKLVMVDLAGSEKGTATGFQGQRFREGASINKSLLALGNCINALSDGKKHIPYRDSKLTRILKDSLGGNCKTVMIANISPSSLSYDDSYNTLKYADRAKRIKFVLKKNTMSVSACLTQYTKVVDEMSHKIEILEKELSEYKSKKCYCKGEPIPESHIETVEIKNPPQPIIPIIAPVPAVTSVTSSNMETAIPTNVVQTINELAARRTEVMKTLSAASTTHYVTLSKIKTKERRIQTIQNLKSGSNISKMEKQVEAFTQQLEQAEAKRDQSKMVNSQINDQINQFRIEYENTVGTVPLTAPEYFEYQNTKMKCEKYFTLSHTRKSVTNYLVEECKKSEALLAEAVKMMSCHYLMCKHYKANTKKMDTDYEKFVASLCGTTVHWSTSDNNENMPISSVGSLEMILSDSALEDGIFFKRSAIAEDISVDAPMMPPHITMQALNPLIKSSQQGTSLNETRLMYPTPNTGTRYPTPQHDTRTRLDETITLSTHDMEFGE